MSVTSLVFSDLTTVHNTVRHLSETFSACEERSCPQITWFNSLDPTLAIYDSMSAFYLSNNENVDGSQYITIMAATSSLDGASKTLIPRSSVASFLSQTKFLS